MFATLHTQDAPQSIDRMIDVFPAHQQQQIRTQLATTIQGVVTQQLLPAPVAGAGSWPAKSWWPRRRCATSIREGKTHQIYSAMQAGGKYGMQSMDQALALLVKNRVIDMDVAEERCTNPDDLHRLVQSA